MALGFHGGYPGLEAGDQILPPCETGFSRQLPKYWTCAYATQDPDYALRRAVDFVGSSPSGPVRPAAAVYEVEIPADVRVPAYWMGPIQVPRARITRVIVRDLRWDGWVHHFAEVDPEFAAAVHERLQDYSRIKPPHMQRFFVSGNAMTHVPVTNTPPTLECFAVGRDRAGKRAMRDGAST